MRPVEKSDTEIVCVLGDDPAVPKSLEQLLASGGFSVGSFNKPKSFLAHVQAHPVPIVILDIWMDEVSGLEVQANLSALSPWTHVIIIRGCKDPFAKLTALHLGVVAFFIEPLTASNFSN